MDPSPNSPSTPVSPNPATPQIRNPPEEREIFSSEILFPCSYPDCDYKSNWKENVGRHERRHSPSANLDFLCHICPRNYRSLVSFLHHMSSQHSKDQLSCPFCPFIRQEFHEFKAHMLAHSMTQSFFNGRSNSNNNDVNKPAAKVKVQRPKSARQKRTQIRGASRRNSASSKIKVEPKVKVEPKSKLEPKTKVEPKIQVEPKIKVEASILKRVLTSAAETGFPCAGCSKSYTLKCNLLRHQRKSCTRRSVANSTPKVQVKVEQQQNQQEESATSSSSVLPHKCPHCSERFASRTLMFRHLKTHRKPEPKTENQADESSRHLADESMQDRTGELNRNETLEPSRIETVQPIRNETVEPSRNETIEPNRNETEKLNPNQKTESNKNQADESRCPYPDCGYTTSRPQVLQTHIRARHQFVPKFEPTDHETHPADQIEKVAERRALLSCEKCSYTTTFTHNMRMHGRIHSGEKPFKCRKPGCDYRARWAQNLSVHQRSCQGGKVKPAQAIVPKVTKKPKRVIRARKTGNLKQTQAKVQAVALNFMQMKPKIEVAAENYPSEEVGMEIETSQRIVPEETRPPTPEMAGIVAQEPDQVSADMAKRPAELIKKVSVGGETLFRCAICGYKSKWKPNLKSHLMVHTDFKPFACPIDGCKYRSKWSQSVRQHSRIVHAVDLPRKMKLDFKENLGSDYLAFLTPVPIKTEREHSKLEVTHDVKKVARARLQPPSKNPTNLTEKNVGPIESSRGKYCLFCDYASKLSKYLRKHLSKCSSCNVITSDGAAQESKEAEISADLKNKWSERASVDDKFQSTNDNAGE